MPLQQRIYWGHFPGLPGLPWISPSLLAQPRSQSRSLPPKPTIQQHSLWSFPFTFSTSGPSGHYLSISRDKFGPANSIPLHSPPPSLQMMLCSVFLPTYLLQNHIQPPHPGNVSWALSPQVHTALARAVASTWHTFSPALKPILLRVQLEYYFSQ